MTKSNLSGGCGCQSELSACPPGPSGCRLVAAGTLAAAPRLLIAAESPAPVPGWVFLLSSWAQPCEQM